MKKTLLVAALAVLFTLTGCATIRTQDNTVIQSEFIYCEATGVIDCEPVL